MSDLPKPGIDSGDGDDPPGGPWKSWPAIYTTLAVWGVVCILFLIWITSTLNVEVGERPGSMDAEIAEALR